MSDALTPQVTSLLSLPAELRNNIYDLVLTTNVDVTCQPYNCGERTSQRLRTYEDGIATELNQMKSTCRQVHTETSALLSTTPHLIFPERIDTTETASTTYAHYLSSLPPSSLFKLPKNQRHGMHPTQRPRLLDPHFRPPRDQRLRLLHPRASRDRNQRLSARRTQRRSSHHGADQKMKIVFLAMRKQYLHGPHPDSFDRRPSVKKIGKVWGGYAADAPELPANLKLRPMVEFGGMDEWLEKLNRHCASLVRRWLSDGF